MTWYPPEPTDPNDLDMPATVHDYGNRRAAVTHPAGDWHPNARATRSRLRARGYEIVAHHGGPVRLPRTAPPSQRRESAHTEV
ncbi:MAG: hypothetical protein JWM41_2172 [Gemmatimonadetes bacterium]|nr:hypothetical protein [Gemmatimonadota bacterium]